jgi:hypothetical protein
MRPMRHSGAPRLILVRRYHKVGHFGDRPPAHSSILTPLSLLVTFEDVCKAAIVVKFDGVVQGALQ